MVGNEFLALGDVQHNGFAVLHMVQVFLACRAIIDRTTCKSHYDAALLFKKDHDEYAALSLIL